MKKQVEDFITEYVASYRLRVRVHTKWGKPSVAFADASDTMFLKLKEVVDPKHFLPTDLLPDAKTVISYFIPFAKETAKSNSLGTAASKQWAQAYTETNQLITNLNIALTSMIGLRGFKAIATMPTHNFDKTNLISCWSDKHVAYVAGLGKFGLHHMIVTQKGCCGRLGSIITNVKITPTQRSTTEFCLHKLDGSCGVCVTKCKLRALTGESLDKQTCYQECLKNAEKYVSLGLADVCGKCIADVPCSFMNPSRKPERKA